MMSAFSAPPLRMASCAQVASPDDHDVGASGRVDRHPERGIVVDREYPAQVAVRLQHVLHHRHRPRPLTARRRPADDGDAGVLAISSSNPAPIRHRRDLGMVDDDDRAFVVEQLGERPRRQSPALRVVAGDVRTTLPPWAAISTVNTGMPAASGPARCAAIASESQGAARSRPRAGDEVLELGRLLRRVHLARDHDQIEVARRRLLPQRVS
jgi:hypothetical protein